jgi:hypothetical protein
MAWGLSTVVLSSKEFALATKPVYFKCLLLLGVQQHIELPWRTLPESFQGIGLPNLALHSLASKLQLLQCNWGFKDETSLALLMGYESFLMDIELYGNPFALDYSRFSLLATSGTWFKNVWELLSDFDVSASMGDKYHLHPARSGDSSLMCEFSKHYSGQDLAALNIVRQHKKVIHLSCIVLCDGQSINKEYLLNTPGDSHLHKFPLQKPTQSDFRLWNRAIRQISSGSLSLPVPLGNYISSPHLDFSWTTDADGTILHLKMASKGDTKYLTYHPSYANRTRSGHRFVRGSTLAKLPLTYYASVTRYSDTKVILHSWTKQFVPATLLASFWENIQSMDNPSMWKNLRWDGDGA